MNGKQRLFPQVYVDIDDVLSETLLIYTEVLKKYFGRIVNFNEIRSFDLGKSFHLPPKELEAFMIVAHEPEVLLSIPPLEGARETLLEWKKKGIYINVVTGRPISSFETSKTWLLKNHIPFDSLSVIDKYGRHKKNTLPKPLSLRTMLKSNFFLAVEDSPKMARFIAKNVQIPIALIDRPWNQTLSRLTGDVKNLVTRCNDWYDVKEKFYNLIDKML